MDVFFYIMGSICTILPLLMGIILKCIPPKEINRYYGFRTKLTMSSQEAWEYSQRICAKLLIIFSSIEILIYLIFVIINPTFLENRKWIVFIVGFVLMVLCVILVIAISLKKTKNFLNKK